jgi:hypothetical protein
MKEGVANLSSTFSRKRLCPPKYCTLQAKANLAVDMLLVVMTEL